MVTGQLRKFLWCGFAPSMLVLSALWAARPAWAGPCDDPNNPCQISGTNQGGSIQSFDATINADPTGYYILEGNIDGGGNAVSPIGSFAGSLNGNNYSISNVTLNASGAEVGLFGQIGASGSVSNLNLSNITITAGSSQASRPIQSDCRV
jgi:PPE-repeat protein